MDILFEYTELLKFHFDHDPLDMAAIDALVHRATASPKALSHIFWDRVLEGYSRAGETVKAMAVYKDIRQRNRIIDTSKVAWRALHELVLALSRNGEWEIAKEVVKQKASECGGPLPKDHDVKVSGQHAQFAFWETIRELDLLEDETVKR
jgi:pentatricopeptide repeat protein